MWGYVLKVLMLMDLCRYGAQVGYCCEGLDTLYGLILAGLTNMGLHAFRQSTKPLGLYSVRLAFGYLFNRLLKMW